MAKDKTCVQGFVNRFEKKGKGEVLYLLPCILSVNFDINMNKIGKSLRERIVLNKTQNSNNVTDIDGPSVKVVEHIQLLR